MRYTADALRQRSRAKRSRQEMIDRAMCKPGYTWNETLQKCLGYGGGGKGKPDYKTPENVAPPKLPDAPPPPSMPDTPQQAIAKEVAARAMKA